MLDINKLQEQTKTLINDLNKSYKHCYNTSFTEVLSTINSSSEKVNHQMMKEQVARQVVKEIDNIQAEKSVQR